MTTHVAHVFTSADGNHQSKYGWVQSVPPFTCDEFVDQYLASTKDSPGTLEHVLTMLDSIAPLDEDTPVGATYSRRGIIEKKMVFTVHKVMFHKAN